MTVRGWIALGGFTKPAFITEHRDEKESNYFEGFIGFLMNLSQNHNVSYSKTACLAWGGIKPTELCKPCTMISLNVPICPWNSHLQRKEHKLYYTIKDLMEFLLCERSTRGRLYSRITLLGTLPSVWDPGKVGVQNALCSVLSWLPGFLYF